MSCICYSLNKILFYSVLLNLYTQYKWSRDLRTRFDESQALLGKLKLTCEERVLGKELEALLQVFEPRYEKTGFLHIRKQRRRSASQ